MIVLKTKFDELDGKFQASVKENGELKAKIEELTKANEALKVDPSNMAKLAEMENNVKVSVESVEKLTTENAELKQKIATLETERVTVERRAMEITASQGTAKVDVTEDDIKPRVSMLSQLAQIRNLQEQRAFFEKNREAITKEMKSK